MTNEGRRILLLITDLEIGGTPTVVRELAVRLNDPLGVHVEVACLSRWGPVADQLREAGIGVTAFGANGIFDFRVIARLIHLIHHRRIDTVFSFLLHANAVAAMAKSFCRDVRLFQSIQTTQPRPRWHWMLQGIIQSAAEKIVVPSDSVAQSAHDWSDIPREILVVIPNAVDIAAFRGVGVPPTFDIQEQGRDALATGNSQTPAPASASRVPPVKCAIGFIGRLDPIKRIPDLIAAMSLIDARFTLDIFGDGAERSSLESEIRRYSLHDRVKLHGAIPRPQTALNSIDILVLPSEAEGFGLVLIEAMAAGVPVIATDVPGIRDVVRHEQTGLLVPVARPDEIARAIHQIADDENLRNRLVANGLKDVCERFSWPAVLNQYCSVLKLEQQ